MRNKLYIMNCVIIIEYSQFILAFNLNKQFQCLNRIPQRITTHYKK
jgi:hypothetical protein